MTKNHSDIFKALADETRLTMLGLLLRYGEMCVCDMEGVLKISQSKASRHLRYLKNAGLIVDRREGLWVHYAIADSVEHEPMAVLNALHEVLLSLIDEELENRFANWLEHKKQGTSVCGSKNR